MEDNGSVPGRPEPIPGRGFKRAGSTCSGACIMEIVSTRDGHVKGFPGVDMEMSAALPTSQW
jgi:hypothetical protein